MYIEIDAQSGFCHGVVRAIQKAEQELTAEGQLYCLGDIVHNGSEVQRLTDGGLRTIDYTDFAHLKNAKVLLRAHGEPPSTYAMAKANGVTIIDASCRVVLNLQKKIREAYERGDTQIVIYGKHGHAEVLGLVGQTNGEAIVVESPDELDKIDFSRNIALFSQTTKSVEGFRELVALIEARRDAGTHFDYHDTICRQVSNRIPDIRAFAARFDLVLFVGGKKSSNGQVLYKECLKVNPNARFISNPHEIEPQWLVDCHSVGVCGATSTPKWLMEQVAERLQTLNFEQAKTNK